MGTQIPPMGMGNMQAFQHQMINQGMQAQMNAMSNQQTAPPNRDLGWLKINITEFENMDHHEKKNILGNLMYPLVEKAVSNPEHVPKITGMLIDLEVLKVSEIVEIMENTEALKDRIDEAIGIINETE